MRFWDLFKTARKPVEPPAPAPVAASVDGPAVAALRHEFGARMDRLESGLNVIRLEWQETIDKVTHVVGRAAKRTRDLEKAEREASEGEEAPPPSEAPEGRAARKERLRQSLMRQGRTG